MTRTPYPPSLRWRAVFQSCDIPQVRLHNICTYPLIGLWLPVVSCIKFSGLLKVVCVSSQYFKSLSFYARCDTFYLSSLSIQYCMLIQASVNRYDITLVRRFFVVKFLRRVDSTRAYAFIGVCLTLIMVCPISTAWCLYTSDMSTRTDSSCYVISQPAASSSPRGCRDIDVLKPSITPFEFLARSCACTCPSFPTTDVPSDAHPYPSPSLVPPIEGFVRPNPSRIPRLRPLQITTHLKAQTHLFCTSCCQLYPSRQYRKWCRQWYSCTSPIAEIQAHCRTTQLGSLRLVPLETGRLRW